MWKGKYRSTDNTKNGKRKGKLLLQNEETTGGKAHMETYFIYFDDHRYLSQSEESKCMWTHSEEDITPSLLCVHIHLLTLFWLRKTSVIVEIWDAIFTVCSHTFTLFWLRKTAVIIKIYQISFLVYVCAFPSEISSFLVRVFLFFLHFLCKSLLS